MPVLYCDIVDVPQAQAQLGARRVPLDELLQAADVVSLHVPLLAETRGLIGREALRRMKRGAFLVNTSRGAVVDQAALIEALQEGWIAGAGLDVFDPEPLPQDSPLLRLKNVVLTPHMAGQADLVPPKAACGAPWAQEQILPTAADHRNIPVEQLPLGPGV
jgi:phosphoglycerate dehydrogenase-like enzyme